jgi:hypothetical protein
MRTRIRICLRATSFASLTWTALGANHGLHVRSRRFRARAMTGDIVTGEIYSRYLFIVDTRSLRAVILDALCSDETAASICRVHIPCRWRRQVQPKHH